MIERLVNTLDALAQSKPESLATSAGRRLAADCADALRLELDCPQQDLSRTQRRALVQLYDLLEREATGPQLIDAARAARASLGEQAARR